MEKVPSITKKCKSSTRCDLRQIFNHFILPTRGQLLCQTESCPNFAHQRRDLSFSKDLKSNFNLEKQNKTKKSPRDRKRKQIDLIKFSKKVLREKKIKIETNRGKKHLDSAFEAKDSLNITFCRISSNQLATCRQNDIPLRQKVRLCDKWSHK